MLQQQGGHRDRDRVQVPSAEAPGCRLRDKIQVGVRLFQMSNLNDLFSILFIFGAQSVNVNVRKRSVLIFIQYKYFHNVHIFKKFNLLLAAFVGVKRINAFYLHDFGIPTQENTASVSLT